MHRMLYNITFVIFIAIFATTAIKILRASDAINDSTTKGFHHRPDATWTFLGQF